MRTAMLAALVMTMTACSAPAAPPPAAAPEPTPPQIRLAVKKVSAHTKRVPYRGKGTFAVVHGKQAPRKGRGQVVRYLVEVERGLPFKGQDFAEQVHDTLNDSRGWARFQRVDHGPVQVRVALTSPHTTDRLCLPLRTGGELSCWNGSRSVINAVRWAKGVPQYHGHLAAYRDYVISHEVGHGLGHHHASCPGRGRRAPVMVQQSKSLESCRPNPWPFPLNGSGPVQAAKR